jgi:transposase IS116/IS110/IS902 family protein/transposase
MEGKSGKNDMTDAAAICEAALRPSMRFVPVKTCEQQGVMSLHRVREGLKEERTGCINQIRGVLAEFGLVFAQSPKILRAVLADVIEDASRALQRAFDHWRELDEHMRWCDSQVGQHVRSSPAAQRAAKIIGIGELGASACTAGIGDFHQFTGGHQLGAWLGLVPKQNSSGGKTSLGLIWPIVLAPCTAQRSRSMIGGLVQMVWAPPPGNGMCIGGIHSVGGSSDGGIDVPEWRCDSTTEPEDPPWSLLSLPSISQRRYFNCTGSSPRPESLSG